MYKALYINKIYCFLSETWQKDTKKGSYLSRTTNSSQELIDELGKLGAYLQ